MSILYLGYIPEGPAAKHIEDAKACYKTKTGHDATVIVVKPNAPPEYDCSPIVVRSQKGMAFGMLLTHTIGPDDVNTPARRAIEEDPAIPIDEIPDLPVDKTVNLFVDSPKRYEAPRRTAGRTQASGGTCPHCLSKVKDFNLLGWWWGWDKGIYPPYWEELRDYVFQRDDYTCSVCNKRFGKGKLVAHHIHHKEDGGIDSARNLSTMCVDCHPDNKPIMP